MDNFKGNETDIQHLIISSLEGTASEEELLALQKWLEESERHFLLFQAYRQDWIQAGCVQRYQTGEAWKKVERRLFHRMPVKRLFLWTRIVGYAALVILMISVGYAILLHNQDRDQEYVAEGNIEPGRKKAILVLGSDKKVVLGDEAEEALLAGNTTVKKEGNTLVYGEKRTKETTEEYNRLITPRGGEYAVVLSDGTRVWLNAESELYYPVHFPEHKREVHLKGEAYFSVSKQAKKPFIVRVGDSRITVLGTEFNVRNYQNEVVTATLVKGAVRIHDAGRECDLLPGQQAVIEEDGIRVREVDTDLYTAWKDGYFIYREKTLEDIMKELSRWYDFAYDYQSEELRRMPLTAKLRKFDRVEDIFDILKRTGRLDFITHGKNVTVLAK